MYPASGLSRIQEEPVVTDSKSFWHWFATNERKILDTIKKDEADRTHSLISLIIPQLHRVNDQFYYSLSSSRANPMEFNITADGVIKNFVLVEEMVTQAPEIKGWKFTALRQPYGTAELFFESKTFMFESSKMAFFSTPHEQRPDQIDITVVYRDSNEKYGAEIRKNCLMAIQAILGELNAATQIDNLQTKAPEPTDPELIPIEKLVDFLRWREMEFVEKYKGVLFDKKLDRGDKYALLQSMPTSKGLVSMATADRFAMRWDETASYPWMLTITISFNGTDKGMPDDATRATINLFEKELGTMINAYEGYLFLLHDTYDSVTTTYIACNEFRNISKMVAGFLKKYEDRLALAYDVTKDKYWSAVGMYRAAIMNF